MFGISQQQTQAVALYRAIHQRRLAQQTLQQAAAVAGYAGEPQAAAGPIE